MNETSGNDTDKQQTNSKGKSHLAPYQFRKGVSGNPKGRPKGGFVDVLRAYAMAEVNGRPRILDAVQFAWNKAFTGPGNSRYAKLLWSAIFPSQSLRITEDHKSITVVMQVAEAPATWKQPVFDVDNAKLIGTDDSEDVEEG